MTMRIFELFTKSCPDHRGARGVFVTDELDYIGAVAEDAHQLGPKRVGQNVAQALFQNWVRHNERPRTNIV
ncbi:MAG: hypothetical protein ACKOGG_05605, partial [Actinomycetota bacterium]